MTKITCKCPDAKGCEWQPQKPFIGCVGPCEQPLREFGSIKSFFKVKADYSLGTGIHRAERRSHVSEIQKELTSNATVIVLGVIHNRTNVRSFRSTIEWFVNFWSDSKTFANPTDSIHAVFRVQSKTPLFDGWTLAMQFEEPQKFAISSADVDFRWNCRHTILTATPKKFNFALNAKRSHNFMALIEG